MPRLYRDVKGKSPLQYFQKNRLIRPVDTTIFVVLNNTLYQGLFEITSVKRLLINTIVIATNGLKRNANANVIEVDTDNSETSVPIGIITGNLSETSIEIDKIIANKISFLLNMNLNLKEVYINRLIKSAVNTKINTLALLGNFCTFNYI